MIAFLKEKFNSYSPFESKLISCSLFNGSTQIALDDILVLIEIFEGKYQFQGMSYTGKQYITQYFEFIQKKQHCNTPQKRQKFLLSIHLILNEFTIGITFAEALLNHKISWCHEQNQVFISGYYQYLQKMASNIQIYHACKVHQYPLGNTYIDTNTKLLWLFKINNLVDYYLVQKINSTLAQYPQIKQQLQETNNEYVLREAMLILWNDIVVLYNFLSHEIMEFIECFKSLQNSQCLQYYELFVEHRKIEAAVLQIFKEKACFDHENVIRKPKVSNISKSTHTMLDEFVWHLKVDINAPRPNTDRKSSVKCRMQESGAITTRAKDTNQSTSTGYLTHRQIKPETDLHQILQLKRRPI